MIVVLVYVNVTADAIDSFLQATLENARASRLEAGVVRFDIIQEQDDPTQFMLIEIYRTEEDPARHKQTAHYLTWRDTVTSMMAEPRRGVRYRILSPAEETWG